MRFIPVGVADAEAEGASVENEQEGLDQPSEPAGFNPPADAGRVEPAVHESPAEAVERVVLVAGEQTPADTPAPSNVDDQRSAGFSKQLMAVEVKLARQIVNSPAEWRFDGLKSEAAGLMNAAASDAEKQLVRGLVDRMDRFAAVSLRHTQAIATTPPPIVSRAVAAPLPAAPVSVRPLAAATTPLPAVAPAPVATASPVVPPSTAPQGAVAGVAPARAAAAGASYDAVGELRPVVSKRPGAPKYALVGRDGKVVTFVSPAEGIDLDPLLGKQVGARGGRGYMPEYGHRHLTARNVTPLGTLRR